MDKLADLLIAIFGKLIDRFNQKRVLRNAQGIAEIYAILKQMVTYNPAIYRMVVWKAEDSGGQIKPGVQLFFSCLYDDFKPPLISPRRYQRVMTDKAYVDDLIMCMAYGVVKRPTAQLEVGCTMERLLRAERITYTELHHIRSVATTIYYVSVCTTHENERFEDPALRVTIETAVRQIQSIGQKLGGFA